MLSGKLPEIIVLPVWMAEAARGGREGITHHASALVVMLKNTHHPPLPSPTFPTPTCSTQQTLAHASSSKLNATFSIKTFLTFPKKVHGFLLC